MRRRMEPAISTVSLRIRNRRKIKVLTKVPFDFAHWHDLRMVLVLEDRCGRSLAARGTP